MFVPGVYRKSSVTYFKILKNGLPQAKGVILDLLCKDFSDREKVRQSAKHLKDTHALRNK
jgi:hypothetical protein